MSKETEKRSHSSKPKYLYLDKFERFKLKMFTTFSGLERTQEKTTKEVRFLKKKFEKVISWIRALSIALVIELAVILYLLYNS